GHTGFEQRVPRARVAVGVRIEEVDPREAVDLQIDESRHRDASPVRRRQAIPGDRVIGDLDVAGNELALDERGLDSQLHRSSALRMTPFAASSRRRAVAASVRASSVRIATFASPSLAVRALSIASAGSPLAWPAIPRTPAGR